MSPADSLALLESTSTTDSLQQTNLVDLRWTHELEKFTLRWN